MSTRENYGLRVAQIERLLRINGPMTATDISREAGFDRDAISRVLTRMRQATPRTPKRIHITDYVTDQEGQRAYPRARYALGDHPCAKKPRAKTKAANSRRWRAAQATRLRTNFVFNLGGLAANTSFQEAA